MVGKTARTYRLFVPTSWRPDKAMPLVLVFHGLDSSSLQIAQYSGFDVLAQKHGFIVAYPDALGRPASWNAAASPSQPDDIGFVRALLDDLLATTGADETRIYVTGHSNGAFMAFRAACDLGERIAAAAPVAGAVGARMGSTYQKLPQPRCGVPILMIHGKQDRLVPYDGGSNGVLEVLSVAESTAFWVKTNGCSSKCQRQEVSQGAVVVETYAGDAEHPPVQLITLLKCGHEWPSPRVGLDATSTIWNFFASHRRAGAASQPSTTATSPATQMQAAPPSPTSRH
jgi:polyhydroxybutyrate depolymerase